MDEKLGVELKKVEKTLFIIKMKFIFQSILRNLFLLILIWVLISYVVGKREGDFIRALCVFIPFSILFGTIYGLLHYKDWLKSEIRRMDSEIRDLLDKLMKSDDSK